MDEVNPDRCDGVGAPMEDAPSASAARVLEILRADAERLDGEIDPARVDSLLDKRALSVHERTWVYRELGMHVPAEEDADSEEDQPDGEAVVAQRTETSIDHIRFLLNGVGKIPLLTADDERRLGRIIRNGEKLRLAVEEKEIVQDEAVRAAVRRSDLAQREMTLANLRLVISISQEYRRRSSLDIADLVQEGIVGLMTAVRKFDPDMEAKLSTYAVWWIRQSIGRAIHDTSKLIRIPVHMMEKITKFKRTTRRLIASNGGRQPTIAEIAAELGWDVNEATSVLAYSQMETVSMDESLKEDSDFTLSDLIASEELPQDEVLEQKQLEDILSGMVDELTEREAEVIKRRFGFMNSAGAEETLETIGTDYGVTRERIRQIEEKALGKLRHPGRSKQLRVYNEN